jgi:hypothetical protein
VRATKSFGLCLNTVPSDGHADDPLNLFRPKHVQTRVAAALWWSAPGVPSGLRGRSTTIGDSDAACMLAVTPRAQQWQNP